MGSDTIVSQSIEGVSQEILNFTMIGLILGCLFAAFFSFRFFKLSLIVMGISTGFAFGSDDLGMLVSDRITGFDAPLILGIICAVVFAILAPKFYKICIYLLGGVIGCVIGYQVAMNVMDSMGISARLITILVCLAFAFICAKLFYRFFKPYLIISSAFLGSVMACVCAAMMIFGENDLAVSVAFIIGVFMSIPAMIVQFRMNRNRRLDL